MNAQAPKMSNTGRRDTPTSQSSARSLRSRTKSDASTTSNDSEAFSAGDFTGDNDDTAEAEESAENGEEPEVTAPSGELLQGLDESDTNASSVQRGTSHGHQTGHYGGVDDETDSSSSSELSTPRDRESTPVDSPASTPAKVHWSAVGPATPKNRELTGPRVVELVDDDDYNAVNYIPDDDDDGNDDSIELLEERDIIAEEARKPEPRIEDFMDEPDEMSNRFSLELEMLSAEEDPASPMNQLELNSPIWNFFPPGTPARKRVRFDETAERQNTLRGFKAGADQWAVAVEDLSPSMRRMIDNEDNGYSSDDDGDTTDEEMPVWVPTPVVTKPTPPRTRSKAKSPRRPLGSGPAIGKFVLEVDSDASICVFNGRTKQIDIITPRKRQPRSGMSSITCSTADNSPRTPMLQLGDGDDSDASPGAYFATDVMLAGQFNNFGASASMFGARVGPPESFMPSDQSWFDLSDPFTAFDEIGFDPTEDEAGTDVNIGDFIDMADDDDVAVEDDLQLTPTAPARVKRRVSSSLRRGSYSVESSKVGAFRRNQEQAKKGEAIEASQAALATLAMETLQGSLNARPKKRRRLSSVSHAGSRLQALFAEE